MMLKLQSHFLEMKVNSHSLSNATDYPSRGWALELFNSTKTSPLFNENTTLSLVPGQWYTTLPCHLMGRLGDHEGSQPLPVPTCAVTDLWIALWLQHSAELHFGARVFVLRLAPTCILLIEIGYRWPLGWVLMALILSEASHLNPSGFLYWLLP